MNWRLAVVLLFWQSSFSIANGQVADPIPDVPPGDVTVWPRIFAAGFTPEEVQENPVGFTQRVGPTDLVGIPDGSGRLIVANYGGRFSLLSRSGEASATPFLDLSDPASPSYSPHFEFGQAHGVTSIAFHPGFNDPASAGFKKFYTLESETAASGTPDFGGANFPSVKGSPHHDGVLYEYTLANVADSECGAGCVKREVFRVLQPGWHHNLGDLLFAADESLFISSADGSTAGTKPPFMSDNSLIMTNLFGKILRIDPSGHNSANGNYGVPDNPFADGPGGRVDEIYAYGLRNPYRLAIDPVSGDLFASETGENNVESIERIVRGGNYGWNLKEGSYLYDPQTKSISVDVDSDLDGVGDVAQANGLTEPLFEYDRDDGRSIIGGVLYRGSKFPELHGQYVFGDFDGRLFYGDPATGQVREMQLAPNGALPSNIHSINTDENGDLYVLGIRKLEDDSYDGWVVRLGIPGDLDNNGTLDVDDIDLLSAAVRSDSLDPIFDLNGDGLVDTNDRVTWVRDLKATWFGDANLDGEFNSSDLVEVFVAAEYEDDRSMNSTWRAGDWNGDGEFDSSDMVVAFRDGGFGQGPRMELNVVPEPAALLSVLGIPIMIAIRRRYRGGERQTNRR